MTRPLIALAACVVVAAGCARLLVVAVREVLETQFPGETK